MHLEMIHVISATTDRHYGPFMTMMVYGLDVAQRGLAQLVRALLCS